MTKVDTRVHVLYLIDHLCAVGGAEAALVRTARLLPRDRYRCTIGTFRLKPELSILKDSPWPVVEFPFKGVLNGQALRTAFELRRFIRSEKVDIAHTFCESANLWGGLVAKLSGCPVLISSRRDMGILRRPKHRFAYRLLNPFVDQVQAVSSAVRNWAIREEALDPKKIITIPNGIDIDEVDRVQKISDLRRMLGLAEDSRLILTVGNLRRVKGIDVLIRAAHRVCREDPNAVFLIVGGYPDSRYCGELKRLVEELSLTSHVHFLGECRNVQSLLHSCDIFCLLSRSEGMSNALLEAMACALPCVVTAVGGNIDVIDDGRTGFVVPSEDPDGTANRILQLLQHPDHARAIGRAGREAITKRFSAAAIVNELARVYDSLVQTRSTVIQHRPIQPQHSS